MSTSLQTTVHHSLHLPRFVISSCLQFDDWNDTRHAYVHARWIACCRRRNGNRTTSEIHYGRLRVSNHQRPSAKISYRDIVSFPLRSEHLLTHSEERTSRRVQDQKRNFLEPQETFCSRLFTTG